MSRSGDDVEMHKVAGEDSDDELSQHLLEKPKTIFTGLTKQQLMEIEKTETHWRKIRIALFILFWVVWLAMLVGAIVIIVLTPKCPYQPILKAWEKTCIYRLNPFAFQDSNNDGVGDLEGLKKRMPYITDELNLKTLILDPIVEGSFGKDYLHLTTDLKSIDKRIGTTQELKDFVQKAWKSGITVIATLDLNGVGFEHPWVKNNIDYFLNSNTTKLAAEKSTCQLSGLTLYTSLKSDSGSCLYLDLDINKPAVVNEIKGVVEHWLSSVGVGGILLTNGAYLAKFNNTAPVDYLKEIRSVFDKVNAAASRKKVLMLEAGGVPTDVNLTKFLSLVDVILPSDFHFSENWDATAAVNKFVDTYAGHDFQVGLSSATPFVQRQNSLAALVGTYLLPNVSVVYMGSELNISAIGKTAPKAPLQYYPKTAKSLVDPDRSIYTMMPWEIKTKTDENYNENSVELLGAVGAPPNTFTLSKQLMALRHKESLLWGKLKLLKNEKSANGLYQLVFVRQAEGFSKIFVIFVKSSGAEKGSAVTLGDACNNGYVRASYPTSNIPLNHQMKLSSIYVDVSERGEALTVVECV